MSDHDFFQRVLAGFDRICITFPEEKLGIKASRLQVPSSLQVTSRLQVFGFCARSAPRRMRVEDSEASKPTELAEEDQKHRLREPSLEGDDPI